MTRGAADNGTCPSTSRRRRLRLVIRMVWVSLLALPLLMWAATPATALPARVLASTADAAIHLPQDEAPHSDAVEWWYFNGHLVGTDPAGHPHEYGFQIVFFRYLHVAPVPFYVGNSAVTDVSRGTFEYDLRTAFQPVPTGGAGFDLHIVDWALNGLNGRDTVAGSTAGYQFQLSTRALKPAVLHGGDGIIPFGPFGTSYYYSWTSLAISGQVVDHGTPVNVTGVSWMDHQWGNYTPAHGGWDWFSMHLSNGVDYMLFFIRDGSGAIVTIDGTRVDRAGEATDLGTAISDTATGSWTSPSTGITYSSGWVVTVPGGQLTLTPVQQDQEQNYTATLGNAYWEGDTRISGTLDGRPVAGVGYTEINPVS
jgi:predicted secreted hydrolase